MEEDPHKLIRVGIRVTRQQQIGGPGDKTIRYDKKPTLEGILINSNYEVDGTNKVAEWLQKYPDWQQQQAWIPREHPSNNYTDPFRHTYEMGDSPDDPIEVIDNGYFWSYDLVTPGGIVEIDERWCEMSEYEKDYYRKDWWYEKPWEDLVDPTDVSSYVIMEIPLPKE